MNNNKRSSVDPEEIAKFAQYASTWWDLDGPLKTLHDINPARLSFVQKHLNLKGTRILDVGCGGGIFAEAMAKAGGIVSGLDAEGDAIETARRHARDSHLAIDYTVSALEDYQHEVFDAVTCLEMLEHVKNPELVLEHTARLLKPGGVLFLSTINRTLKAYFSVIVAAEYLLRILPKQTHDYDQFIKPSELMTSARKMGFELLEMSGLDYNPFSRQARLVSSVSTNYLLALRRV